MRKLIVAAFISLDNVIQSPGGPEEDTSGGFRLGGWIVPYADETFGQAIQDLFSQPFELLLGRRTYDIFAAYWPHIQADSNNRAIADLFNSVPKHVATHRSDTLDWQNSHALEGNLADAIHALKHQDGATLLTQGSGDLVRQLLAAGLVDELQHDDACFVGHRDSRRGSAIFIHFLDDPVASDGVAGIDRFLEVECHTGSQPADLSADLGDQTGRQQAM